MAGGIYYNHALGRQLDHRLYDGKCLKWIEIIERMRVIMN